MAKPARRVALGITGSIAAFKAPALVRALVKKGFEVRCVLTPNGAHFTTPLTLAALSRHPVATALHDPALWDMAHLSLASWRFFSARPSEPPIKPVPMIVTCLKAMGK
jgi:phosphopantothenoylcysteine decarboxylase/phosphopantothenate--cysteine ligase